MNAVVLARVPRTPLEDVLLRRTREWAATVAPGRWSEAEALGDDIEGPVIVAAIDAPRLSPAHAEVARLDLREGVDVSFGPTFGGGLYLVAMREPRPDVLPERWDAADGFTEAIRLAHAAGLEIGWLRMERTVSTRADRDALRADPLVAPEVRALL